MTLAPHADTRQPKPSGAGNERLAELVRRHQAMVWRYLRLLGADDHEADDLMQDTYLLAAEHLQRGDELREPPAFLRAVARNLLIGARRRQRRRGFDVPWADAVDGALQRDGGMLEDHRIDLLRACVERLTGRMREAVHRHHMEGEPCRQVAERLGIGDNGVKSLLSRARAALRGCVDDKLRQERTG